MSALGAAGRTRSLVWNDDSDFQTQLVKHLPIQLVDWNKRACPRSGCRACEEAWKAVPAKMSVAVFFKDPVQISRIFIKQLRNTGIIRVQFIKWVFPAMGVVNDETVGKTVYEVETDGNACSSVLPINIGPNRSGINLEVPAGGSQENLPARLAKKAVGGLLITMEPRPNGAGPNYGPFIEYVRVHGRVLYPKNPSIYAPVQTAVFNKRR